MKKKTKNNTRSNNNSLLSGNSPIKDRFSKPTEKELQMIADKLDAWSAQDTALKTVDFIVDHGFSVTRFYTWAAEYEPLREAIERANYRIGSRREKKALMREFEPTIVRQTMSFYDKQYAEHWAKEKQEQPEEKKYLIISEVIENDPRVPVKKNDKAK